jgi:multidrug efflux pump
LLGCFLVLLLVGGFLFMRVPICFVPEEDQGFAIGMVMMPPGTSQRLTWTSGTAMEGFVVPVPVIGLNG